MTHWSAAGANPRGPRRRRCELAAHRAPSTDQGATSPNALPLAASGEGPLPTRRCTLAPRQQERAHAVGRRCLGRIASGSAAVTGWTCVSRPSASTQAADRGPGPPDVSARSATRGSSPRLTPRASARSSRRTSRSDSSAGSSPDRAGSTSTARPAVLQSLATVPPISDELLHEPRALRGGPSEARPARARAPPSPSRCCPGSRRPRGRRASRFANCVLAR